MAFTLTIKQKKEVEIDEVKQIVTRSFLFEDTEIKSTTSPNVSQAVSLSLVKADSFDNTEPVTIDLGITKELAFEWKLYKQNLDRSEGTGVLGPGKIPSTIITYQEMLNYLEDTIGQPGSGFTDYEITITDKFRTRTAIYTFEDLGIDVGSSIYPSGTMKFKWKKQVV